MIHDQPPAQSGLTGPLLNGIEKGIQAAGVLLAAAFVIALYWPALHFSYRRDDFVWLSLGNNVGEGRGLWWALFSPQAQGTILPPSHRPSPTEEWVGLFTLGEQWFWYYHGIGGF